MSEADLALPREMIRGLHAWWAGLLGHGPTAPEDMASRLRLDALGIGLSQVMTQLFQERPDYPAFEAWVRATAGDPDPLAVARYHAWLDGAPPPEAQRAYIAAIDAMPDVLDADEIAQWDRDGYVILRKAIRPQDAAAAAAFLQEEVARRRAEGSQSASLMVELYQGEPLVPARRSRRIQKAFAQLTGTADLWSCAERMSLNPPVGHNANLGARLHFDLSLIPPVTFATQGILYLTDTSPDQGALELVPGFHRRIDGWLEALGDADPRAQDLSAEAITVGGNAGDLLIWHLALPHGPSPNRTDRPRLAQYVNFYSADEYRNPEWR